MKLHPHMMPPEGDDAEIKSMEFVYKRGQAMNIYIGIDPGLTGAVASITSEGRFVEVHDAPVVQFTDTKRKEYDDDEMAGILRAMVARGITIVAIEAQRSMPGQGVASMLKLGLGYGLWRGIIAGLRLPSVIVQPRQWVKDMQAGSEKEHRVLNAKRLFPAVPELTKTKHGRADALLIAEWARRHVGGHYGIRKADDKL